MIDYATGTSDLLQWVRIINAIETSRWPHDQVLDVGAGYGKACVLLREMLNVKPSRIVALEPDRRAFCHRLICGNGAGYDETHYETAAEWDDWDRFDTVLMADVIEHMPADEGRQVLARIPGQVIVSTPIDPEVAEHDQHAADIPPLERHVSQWTVRDFYLTGRLSGDWTVGTQLVVRLAPKVAS